MLTQSIQKLVLTSLLGITAMWTASCCSHRVSSRPNVETDRTVGQALVVENLTTNTLTLLPAPGRNETAPKVLQPGAKTPLEFTLSKQTNQGPAGEIELVLVTTNSSSYVGQNATDLIILSRFGDSAVTRELRIVPGVCLFVTNTGTQHALPIRNPPLAGVPLKRLCP